MSDHLVLYVDRLVRPVTVESVTQPAEAHPEPSSGAGGSVMDAAGPSNSGRPVEVDARSESEHGDGCNEDEPLIQSVECRICQEEDSVNNLETPCACSGSLKVSLLETLGLNFLIKACFVHIHPSVNRVVKKKVYFILLRMMTVGKISYLILETMEMA